MTQKSQEIRMILPTLSWSTVDKWVIFGNDAAKRKPAHRSQGIVGAQHSGFTLFGGSLFPMSNYLNTTEQKRGEIHDGQTMSQRCHDDAHNIESKWTI